MPSELGIEPLNLLLERTNITSLEAFEIESGTIPLSSFSPRWSRSRLGSETPILDGSLLENWFCVNAIICNVEILKIVAGIGPIKLLYWRYSPSIFGSIPISSGSEPDKILNNN